MNSTISFVNIYSIAAVADVTQCSSEPSTAGSDDGVAQKGVATGCTRQLEKSSHRELIDTITILTRKVDEFSNAMQNGAKTSPEIESQSRSPVTRSSGESPTSSTPQESPASPDTSIESGDETTDPELAMEAGKGDAPGEQTWSSSYHLIDVSNYKLKEDQASDRIGFLESEVAALEQVVACKENEILDVQEDHEAAIDDLKEQLAAAEARVAASDADLRKEQASKNKIMTQRNEFANANKQLKAQLTTGQQGDSPLVTIQRGAMEQLQADNRKKDEQLAAAAAALKKEHCDGGFWHGAFILAITELEHANPDAAMRYNGIVRRKDEKISELQEQLDEAREVAREAYAAREDERLKHSGTVIGYRKWADEFRRSMGTMSEVYERLQGDINNLGHALVSKMPQDEVAGAFTEACERIDVENSKLSLAGKNFDEQIIAQNEANSALEARIVELEEALELEVQKHKLTMCEPRALQRELDENEGRHELVVDDLTDKLKELEKALDKQTKAKDSLEQHALAGTLAETVVRGLNDQIEALKHEITRLSVINGEWQTAYAHQNGALLEARGVGSDGQDLDIGISGIHHQEIMNLQVEVLRRRAQVAEAPLLEGLGKFADTIEKKGGTLAAWGIQYEVDHVDTK